MLKITLNMISTILKYFCMLKVKPIYILTLFFICVLRVNSQVLYAPPVDCSKACSGGLGVVKSGSICTSGTLSTVNSQCCCPLAVPSPSPANCSKACNSLPGVIKTGSTCVIGTPSSTNSQCCCLPSPTPIPTPLDCSMACNGLVATPKPISGSCAPFVISSINPSCCCPMPVCGDGSINQSSEQCDSGGVDTVSCNKNCTASKCGDGYKNPLSVEECDDGNSKDLDGCSKNCMFEYCCDSGDYDICARTDLAKKCDAFSPKYSNNICDYACPGDDTFYCDMGTCTNVRPIQATGIKSYASKKLCEQGCGSFCCGKNNQCIDLKANPSTTDCVSSNTYEFAGDCQMSCPENNCCVCNHWVGTNCEQFGEEECKKRDPQCEWNLFTGRCSSNSGELYKDCCDNWLNDSEQSSCTFKTKNIISVDQGTYNVDFGDPTGGFTSCKTFKEKYCGHGLGCSGIAQKVTLCINRYASCNNFNFDDVGCSTFDDLHSAWLYMKNIQEHLAEGQAITYSANQCTSSISLPGSCSRTIFNVTINSVSNESQECNFGYSCHPNAYSETAFCMDGGVTKCKNCLSPSILNTIINPLDSVYDRYFWTEVPLSECSATTETNANGNNACINSLTGNKGYCIGECCPYRGKDDLCKVDPNCKQVFCDGSIAPTCSNANGACPVEQRCVSVVGPGGVQTCTCAKAISN